MARKRNLKTIFRWIGIVGSIICLVIFINTPSFPTPDKLLIFLAFVFMTLGQATELIRRLLPFVALLLVYESFRGLVPLINHRVEFSWMVDADKALFGSLPTASLQHAWWHGSLMWYDFVFYLAYLLHFVVPVGLAILIWKKRDWFYWRFVWSFLSLSFMGFLTYLALPAAPPWMAAEQGYIEPITRISSHVWYALGIHDFPSLYNKIAPNPVAAVPSLHAAYAVLFAIIITKLFGKKWGLLASVYPVVLSLGVVYQGEHYVIDVTLGAIYAFVAYFLAMWGFRRFSATHNNELKKATDKD
ncbi:MAG TPA: phosphatase PAP2 family protein [Candidatus Saccharimonadales bacterium]|nr:phosphatase PAP2 family protein [Candidatus Saccharimonadales bacterium]